MQNRLQNIFTSLERRLTRLLPTYPFDRDDQGNFPDVQAVHAYFINLPDPIVCVLSSRMLEICYRLRILRNRIMPSFTRNYYHLNHIIVAARNIISSRRHYVRDCDRLHGILRRRCQTIGRRINGYNRLVRGSNESLYESSAGDTSSSSNSSVSEVNDNNDMLANFATEIINGQRSNVSSDNEQSTEEDEDEQAPQLYHRMPSSPTFSQATTHLNEDLDLDTFDLDDE